jgi:hypothetical protein
VVKDNPDPRATKVLPGHPDLREKEALPVQLDQPVRLAPLALLEASARRAQLVPLARRAVLRQTVCIH